MHNGCSISFFSKVVKLCRRMLHAKAPAGRTMRIQDTIATAWILSGVRDLLLASAIEQEHLFFRPSVFHQIMALEKVFKGALLFAQADAYDGLPKQEALRAADKKARAWGHDLHRILQEADKTFAPWSSSRILGKKYGQLSGRDLIDACIVGYEETRYPTPLPVSSRYPVEEPWGFYDPLNSTAPRDCIYELCREMLAQLKLRGGVAGLHQRITEELLSTEIGQRFSRQFFADRESDML